MNVVSSQSSLSPTSGSTQPDNLSFYYLLFFLSGFPALLYQIVWQRALFTLYGVNIESVTMIVAVFMLGLGLGSLAGGKISTTTRPLLSFGCIEVCIGLFGSISLFLFHAIGKLTAGHSTLVTGVVAFSLLLLPTVLMGSTLPLLVEHVVRSTGNVGESVSSLYAVNTFGSAVACFAAAVMLMGTFGQLGVVRIACCFNLVVGVSAIVIGSRTVSVAKPTMVRTKAAVATIPLWIGVLLAGVTGFVALAYEIIWYRVYSFTTGGKSASFALLLAFYLGGIAIGSVFVQKICIEQADLHRALRFTASVVLFGSVSAFLIGPAVAHTVVHAPLALTYFFVMLSAGLLGSAFPLLAHATINSKNGAGKGISYLYLSNIVGSTLGSFLVGFVILNYFSTRATSTFLLCTGMLTFLMLVLLSAPRGKLFPIITVCVVFFIALLASKPLYSGMYERLQEKRNYRAGDEFSAFVENRSGEISVTQDGTVYGGGVYDGKFSTDLAHDSNGIFRAFAVTALHPHPTSMLIIGLSSGSWAQVVANSPTVRDITIVEINPGYASLIQQHENVKSLLANPKVHFVIDDGRRWLVSHPDRKFDFILMNTSLSWRANATNLVSREFLELIRTHLNDGGIAFYNTSWSEDVMATAVSVFPHTVRVANFMAVSDCPFDFDANRWRDSLSNYQIDGHSVFDISNPIDRKKFEFLITAKDQPVAEHSFYESRASLVNRAKGHRIITDDNMGTEWN